MSANNWAIVLFEIGKCDSCCYSCVCCPGYAVAEAKAVMDGSETWFNVTCYNFLTTRWYAKRLYFSRIFFLLKSYRAWRLMRSAYGIPGDAWTDLALCVCCPCCIANQMYQTADALGPVRNKGRYFNDRPGTSALFSQIHFDKSISTMKRSTFSGCLV